MNKTTKTMGASQRTLVIHNARSIPAPGKVGARRLVRACCSKGAGELSLYEIINPEDARVECRWCLKQAQDD